MYASLKFQKDKWKPKTPKSKSKLLQDSMILDLDVVRQSKLVSFLLFNFVHFNILYQRHVGGISDQKLQAFIQCAFKLDAIEWDQLQHQYSAEQVFFIWYNILIFTFCRQST